MDDETLFAYHSVITPLGDNDPDPDEGNKENHSVYDLGGN